MFERLTRSAPALLMSFVLTGAAVGAPGAAVAAETGGAEANPASIELRKSFRFVRHSGRRTSPPEQRGADGGAASGSAGGTSSLPLGAVAEALGEQLQSSGTLHLPDIGKGGIVLQGSTTPILETAAGRHLIIDRSRTIDPGLVDAIPRRWPGFSVVQPPAGSNLREVVGLVLDAAGYDSVLRSTPLTFGRGVTLQITPDFVVLRSESDLLAGETRAISVVDLPAALPPELRALAGEQRVRIVELTPDGAPAGVDEATWRDPAGRVTTMETARLTPIIGEIAGALGLAVGRHATLPATVGQPTASADLRISRDGNAAYVFEKPDQRSQEYLVNRGETAIVLNSAADLPQAIGGLLRHFGIPAIGPTVEFYRAPTPGSTRRFVINVPGWLAETGGRRLLITGTTPPPQVRLYLTREGIDIFEYRVAGR